MHMRVTCSHNMTVMYSLCCRPGGFHVPVDTVHPYLLLSSSHSSARWYHLQSISSDVFLVSPHGVAKPHQSCFPAPLCDVPYFKSLPDDIIVFTWYLSMWPHAHLHIFIDVTSNFFHVGASHWYLFPFLTP